MPRTKKVAVNLEDAHEQGAHDIEVVDECSLCQLEAAEAARLIRGKKRKKTKLSPEHQKIVEDWKRGVTIAQIRNRTNLKRSQIRKILEDGVGGKAEFKKLRQTGAGGMRGKKGRQIAQKEALPPDSFVVPDFGVPRITSARKSDGWTCRSIKTGYDKDGFAEYTLVHMSPDGVEYVEAGPNEHADLVHDFPENSAGYGLPSYRMKKLEYTAISRISEDLERQAEELRQAALRKAESKREKRRERKIRRKGALSR